MGSTLRMSFLEKVSSLLVRSAARLVASRMRARWLEDRWSGGRILSFLEGGYEIDALARSSRAHVEELAGLKSTSPEGGLTVN